MPRTNNGYGPYRPAWETVGAVAVLMCLVLVLAALTRQAMDSPDPGPTPAPTVSAPEAPTTLRTVDQGDEGGETWCEHLMTQPSYRYRAGEDAVVTVPDGPTLIAELAGDGTLSEYACEVLALEYWSHIDTGTLVTDD